MNNPITTGLLCLLTMIVGMAAGYNVGHEAGRRDTAADCRDGMFIYSRQQYDCRRIETMTAREWAAKRESMNQ